MFMELPLSILTANINQAKNEELSSGSLAHFVQTKLSGLLDVLSISSSSPIKSIILFVEDYIDTVPEHLLALHEHSKEVRLHTYVQPFLEMCCTYFIKPPSIIENVSGLEGLLDKAYMAHRVLEELNDQVMSLSGGVPLAPMDMSMANLIGHTLIGDELANQLDHLVLLTIETTKVDNTVFEDNKVKKQLEEHRLTGWAQVSERWPSFTKDCSLHLNLNS